VLSGVDQLWRARYHLCSAARGARLPGRDPGCILAPGDRLGSGSHDVRRVDPGGPADGYHASQHPTGPWCITRIAAVNMPATTTPTC
jgi:hypothetical protein